MSSYSGLTGSGSFRGFHKSQATGAPAKTSRMQQFCGVFDYVGDMEFTQEMFPDFFRRF